MSNNYEDKEVRFSNFIESDKAKNLLRKRYNAEKRFKIYGFGAIIISVVFLCILLFSILLSGYTAFFNSKIALKIDVLSLSNIYDDLSKRDFKDISDSDFEDLIRSSLSSIFPDFSSRREIITLNTTLTSSANEELRKYFAKNNINSISDIKTKNKQLLVWFTASSDIDMMNKNKIDLSNIEEGDKTYIQATIVKKLKELNQIKYGPNLTFFTNGDSSDPAYAGILTSFVGSVLTLIVFLALSCPIAVLTAFYLEEFAPKNNRWTDFLEININNLASVPSIIFGLLGLTIYINFMHLPRSASIVGGMTLMLMVLPTIIISTRNAIKSVPQSVKDAAIALGASHMQMTLHHTFILSLPGIMTGIILATARAVGETAPLLMIGMVAFISTIPHNLMDPATTMPVQIYLWANNSEVGFVEKTSAAIIILLLLLMIVNSFAIIIRKKFEKRW